MSDEITAANRQCRDLTAKDFNDARLRKKQMPIRIIRKCYSCGFFRYEEPNKTICSYEGKFLKQPYNIPKWCHLEKKILED